MSAWAEWKHGMITEAEYHAAVRMETEMEMLAEDKARGYYVEDEGGDNLPVERSEL